MIINSAPAFRLFSPGQLFINGSALSQQGKPESTNIADNLPIRAKPNTGFAEQKMFAVLEKAMHENGVSLEGLQAADFTPENVAGRLLDFAQQVSENHPDSLPDVQKGLQRGFKDARKILDGMGLFQGDIKENFQATKKLLQQWMQQLKQGHGVEMAHGAEDVATHPVAEISASATMQFHAFAESTQQSTVIEIQTQEGDVVAIEIQNATERQQSALQMQDENGSLDFFQDSFAMQSSFNISVQGDLNEDEQRAIESLMGDMEQVSSDFFAGDRQQAFQSAQAIGMDMQQLAGFNIDMRLQQNITAVSAYQQVDSYGEFTTGQPLSLDEQLQTASEFLEQAKTLLQGSVTVLEQFADPNSAFTDLFSGVEHALDPASVAEDTHNADTGVALAQHLADDLLPQAEV